MPQMKDFIAELWVSLEPNHPKFGDVHHKMRGVAYAFSDSKDGAAKAIRAYCSQYLYQLEEVVRIDEANEVANFSNPVVAVHVQKARRFGCALETFGVVTKPEKN